MIKPATKKSQPPPTQPTTGQPTTGQPTTGQPTTGAGGLVGQVQDAYADPLSFEGLTSLDNYGDGSGAAQSVYDRAYAMLEPQLDREENRLRTDLVSRGLPDTSEAYNDAYGAFSDRRGRTLNDLSLASVLAGSNERRANFGQALTQRNQELSERRLARSQPVSDLASLLAGTTSLPQFPSYTNYAVQAPDYQGLVGSNYAAAAGANAAQTGGFYGGVGAALGGLFSDPALKEDIERVGELDSGLPVYKYRYKGDPTTRIGLMADEVEAVNPAAVGEVAGFKTVDYAMAA